MKYKELLDASALPRAIKDELIRKLGDKDVPPPRIPTSREVQLEVENRILRERIAELERKA
jgi:hypothetical protein